MNRNTFGTLYIVATPIGNRKDFSLRAIETLKIVDFIAAEDTRHSVPLLQEYGINKPLVAFHEHNERQHVEKILARLKQGESMAYISDAGTPLISDPGYHLVQAAHNEGVRVIPIPGACAAIAALSVAGLPTDRFVFEGFLPAKSAARLQRLKTLEHEPRTLIFYEAPHRILDLLQALLEVFGPLRQMVMARELTKLFETVRAGAISEILEWATTDANQQKGEFVIVVAGAPEQEIDAETMAVDDVLKVLLEELPVKKAAEMAAKLTGKRKNELYQRALALKK